MIKDNFCDSSEVQHFKVDKPKKKKKKHFVPKNSNNIDFNKCFS